MGMAGHPSAQPQPNDLQPGDLHGPCQPPCRPGRRPGARGAPAQVDLDRGRRPLCRPSAPSEVMKMPRTFGRIQTDIWDDADFRALSEPAQRLYFMLISQSDLSLAGVLPLTPARWAGYSFQSTEDGINKALDELVATRFLLGDTASQEGAT